MLYTRIIAFLLSCGNIFHVNMHVAHEESVSFSLSKQYNNKRVLTSFESLKAGSAMDCTSACARDHNCKCVSYHSNQNVCEKSNMTTAANLTDEAPWISVWRLGHIDHCFRESCYHLHTEKLTWYDAKENCESTGGHLADIKTAEEQASLAALMAQNDIISNSAYIGANDIVVEGVFRWSDGSLLTETFIGWGHLQPDNNMSYGGEDCLELADSHDYTWNDSNCSNLRISICEYDF